MTNDAAAASPPAELPERFQAHAAEALSRPVNPAWLSRARQRVERLREHLSDVMRPQESLGISRHLLLNEKRSGDAGGMLRLLGFVHLLTATGIHLYALSRWISLFFRTMAVAAGIPVPFALPLARTSGTASWLLAWLLAGGRAGMLRPLLVVALRSVGEHLGLKWRKWSPLALALGIDLIWAGISGWRSGGSGHWPQAWEFHAGGLYALAVGGGLMVAGTERPRGMLDGLRAHLRLAVGSWIFTALWEAWLTGIVSIATPLWSLVTIPIFSLGVLPALLLSAISGQDHGLALATRMTEKLFVPLLELALKLPSLWVIDRASLALGAALAAVLLVAANFARSSRRFAAVGFAIGLLLILARVGSEAFPEARPAAQAPEFARAAQVEQLDVGQGDAALIRALSGEAGLIDAGAERALNWEDWIKLFAQRGITRISWVALSHLDADHSSGVLRLAKVIAIDCVATSAEELETERAPRFVARLAREGIVLRDWSARCIPFPVLGPPENSRRHARPEANGNMSAVFVPLATGGFYLAAGDATVRAEPRFAHWALTQNFLPGPRILKLSHHGAKTSSDEEFLRLVHPDQAWISVGLHNHYGHPSPEVLARLLRLGIPWRRTDQEGRLGSATLSCRNHSLYK